MKLTDEQVKELTWDDWIYDDTMNDEGDPDPLYEVVSREQIYYDLEKSYVTDRVVIKDREGSFFTADLMKNYYHDNKNVKWKQVYPYTETVIKYKE